MFDRYTLLFGLILFMIFAFIAIVSLLNKNEEVYLIKAVDGEYHPYSWWQPYIEKYNLNVATPTQLEQAHKNGAHWCSWGFLSDQGRGYPMQATEDSCVAGTTIKAFNESYMANLTIYDVKPKQSEANTIYPDLIITPFNWQSGKWSAYS